MKRRQTADRQTALRFLPGAVRLQPARIAPAPAGDDDRNGRYARHVPDELAPPEEDDLGYSFPSTPSELRRLSDDELAVVYRKVAYGGRFAFDRMVEQELAIRLVRSLREFKRAADRSSLVLIWLTVVLVVLTAAILWLTYRLD